MTFIDLSPVINQIEIDVVILSRKKYICIIQNREEFNHCSYCIYVLIFVLILALLIATHICYSICYYAVLLDCLGQYYSKCYQHLKIYIDAPNYRMK